MTIIVYKTTNKINNKFYLGVHNCHATCKSKYSKDCKYLGSGFVLKKAIKKYGRLNFIRETLMEFDTKEEAYDYEAWLVNDYMINRPDCYNAVPGGQGGVGKEVSDDTRRKLSDAGMGRPAWNKGMEGVSRGWPKGQERTENQKEYLRQLQLGKEPWNKGQTGVQVVSEETRQKLSKSHTGKTQPIVECPHCNKSGGMNTMQRWHFNRCKYKYIK